MTILSFHCQDNTSLAVKYSTYWESVKGNRVSPWDGSPFDSVCKHRLNEKLEMRNEKCEMRNGGAAHFVILSGEKRRMLKNGLSETGELSRRI